MKSLSKTETPIYFLLCVQRFQILFNKKDVQKAMSLRTIGTKITVRTKKMFYDFYLILASQLFK